GKDGLNGDNGTSCTATVNQDGNFDLVCGGQKVGTITNGKDGRNGNDGTSCTAKSVKNAAGLEGVEVTCGGAVVDTIWNGNDGVGCSVKDGGDGSVTLTCGEGKTTLYKAMCGATAYDPTKAFCSEGELYSCDDKPYDPAKSFCSEGELYSCDDKPYDPAKSFCSEGELYSCDDKPYDPAKSFCSEGELFSCNGKPYDPLKSFCSEGELFSCDDKPYDPKKQYCLEVTRDGSDIYSVEELLTDARDEQNIQVYKTVKICNDDETSCQTWMAENLNYSVNPGEQSWCGGGEKKTTNEGDCAVYGRLYTWAAAVGKSEDECGYGHECDLSDAKNEKGEVRGVCPEGWHLPSYDEWDALITAVGGKAGQKLKAESDLWNYHEGISNDDSYGFSALPAGARDYNGDFVSAGDFAIFWSASGDSSDYAYRVLLYYYGESADLSYGNKNFSFSVRCLQNN
ncbi:MAG: fibrobacter succinogenes major paralogous domain-containing protein, partial [Fibrobacter sp.]|nr:fibrobacter succinogenes major paralogous domain-containing protein [Fibrobacter sp.]